MLIPYLLREIIEEQLKRTNYFTILLMSSLRIITSKNFIYKVEFVLSISDSENASFREKAEN